MPIYSRPASPHYPPAAHTNSPAIQPQVQLLHPPQLKSTAATDTLSQCQLPHLLICNAICWIQPCHQLPQHYPKTAATHATDCSYLLHSSISTSISTSEAESIQQALTSTHRFHRSQLDCLDAAPREPATTMCALKWCAAAPPFGRPISALILQCNASQNTMRSCCYSYGRQTHQPVIVGPWTLMVLETIDLQARGVIMHN